jgi:GTP-binding protein HflX
VFISALRGIGLHTLKEELLSLIRRDYVERLAYIPVSEPEAIARVHELADVLNEDYLYAQNGMVEARLNGAADDAQAVARMHFRAAPRNEARLRKSLASIGDFRSVDEAASLPDR